MKNKKILAVIVALAMVFGSFSMSFAATEAEAATTNAVTFTDMTGHWGATAIQKWAGYGIINGFEGLFRPDDSITRGEMAVILDNMMDYQEIATNSFTDLQAGQFYTDAVLKANAAGIIKGDGVIVRPTDKITKEEAAIMMSRAFAVKEVSSTKAFLDASAVSTWATGAVFGMEAKGYVSGFGGYFNPKATITRAEVVTMINNIVKAYFTTAGTYTENVAGTAVIKVPNVILKGVTVSENLIIAEGVAKGDATLDSVTVKGETVVRGGGENSIHITGTSNLSSIRIEKDGDKLRIVVSDGSTVTTVEVAVGEDIVITGKVGTVEVTAPNSTVYATNAQINNAIIEGSNSTIVVGAQATINTLSVASTAQNTAVQTQTGGVVNTVTAAAPVAVSGTGTVTNVTLNAGSNGSSITTPKTVTSVTSGVTGVTGGGGTAIPAGSTGTNGTTENAPATVSTTPTTPTSGGNGGGGGGGGVLTPSIGITKVTSGGVEITPSSGVYQIANTATKNNTGIDVAISNTSNVNFSVTLSIKNSSDVVIASASAGGITKAYLDILSSTGYVTFADLSNLLSHLGTSHSGWYYDSPGHITSGNSEAVLNAAIDNMFARMTDNETYTATVTLTPAGGSAGTANIQLRMLP